MPDAYENFLTYEPEFRRLQSVSPMSSREQENFFNSDHSKINSSGFFMSLSTESINMNRYDSMIKAQAFDIVGNTMDSEIQINQYDQTEIKILVQPVEKFRFRYKSEMMGTHGSLLGEREDFSNKKEVPTVQLLNCPVKNAVVRCTLVTADDGRRFPHAHHLVRKNNNTDKDDPHDIEVCAENNFIATFNSMGIIHTAKKYIKEEILRKRKIEILEEKRRTNLNDAAINIREELKMQEEAESAQKWMNLNSVALCFQGFYYGENNILHPLTEKVYSRPINNLKSALTGELKISRMNKHTCSCEGNEEVWLLVEKVGKKNIKIKFYEVDDKDNVIWEAHGRFSELDVHHQYAIVFRTPPYKDTNIVSAKEVFVKLERPSDGEISNSLRFIYKPLDKLSKRKRQRLISSSENEELNENNYTQYPSLENCTSIGETFINLDNDISTLSVELKELLNEDIQFDTQEAREYFNDMTNIENYLSLLSAMSNPCINSDLVTDGDDLTEFEIEKTHFAKDIIKKVINVLKDVQLKRTSKESSIIKIRGMLQETTNFEDTPLHFSLRHELYEISKCILTIISSDALFKNIINIKNISGKTPLHLAVLQNQSEIVGVLLKLGADPNLCDEDDITPLHNAVVINALGCLEELLRSNVNLEVYTESGWSPVHLAAKIGSLQALHALVIAGADINSGDMSYGRTALHIAVDSGHKHIVNYLLTKTKIDINMKNFGGNTALHSAVVKGGKCAEEFIKILRRYGADPKIRNNNIKSEEEENLSTLSIGVASNIFKMPTIKIEKDDLDDDDSLKFGESPFDLAQNDIRLMQLLRDRSIENSENLKEEAVLTKKFENDTPSSISPNLVIRKSTNLQKCISPVYKKETNMNSIRAQLRDNREDEEEKLTDEHIELVKDILDRTGVWEKLAHHTNHGSLVRLYRKTQSPSRALLRKIKLQQPDITVRQVKKFLVDIDAFEAASLLEKNEL